MATRNSFLLSFFHVPLDSVRSQFSQKLEAPDRNLGPAPAETNSGEEPNLLAQFRQQSLLGLLEHLTCTAAVEPSASAESTCSVPCAAEARI
uniref:Uncharacterized protein n=1 Tax=Arundo donax TaxID=35708 RepID=A0A0A8Z863_ARUDO